MCEGLNSLFKDNIAVLGRYGVLVDPVESAESIVNGVSVGIKRGHNRTNSL